MKKYLKAFGAIVIVFAQGCYCISERETSAVFVQNVGQNVSTRHKYSVSCVYEGDTTKTIKSDLRFFPKFQPDVFSAEGCPVVLRVSFENMDIAGYYWTYFLCGTFPILNEVTTTFFCAVELANVSDGVKSFKLLNRYEGASTFMHPGAYLCNTGVPDIDDCVVFSENEQKTGEGPGGGTSFMTYEISLNTPLFQEALAYAVAVKLKELEDAGKVDAMLGKEAVSRSSASAHNIIRLDRDAVKSFSYSFEIELAQTPSDMKAAVRAVLEEFMKALKEDYLEATPGTDAASLRISFSGLKRNGLRLSGSAAALTIKPVSMEYDTNMRRGKLAVRFNAGQKTEAREWIKRNIKALAMDQNIAIKSGQLPSDATCHFVSEEISSNVMTVEFKIQ